MARRYTLRFNHDKLDAQQKAAILGEVIHLDYLFFEKDRNFCSVEGDSNSGCIYITLCTAYCRGSLCPIVSAAVDFVAAVLGCCWCEPAPCGNTNPMA